MLKNTWKILPIFLGAFLFFSNSASAFSPYDQGTITGTVNMGNATYSQDAFNISGIVDSSSVNTMSLYFDGNIGSQSQAQIISNCPSAEITVSIYSNGASFVSSYNIPFVVGGIFNATSTIPAWHDFNFSGLTFTNLTGGNSPWTIQTGISGYSGCTLNQFSAEFGVGTSNSYISNFVTNATTVAPAIYFNGSPPPPTTSGSTTGQGVTASSTNPIIFQAPPFFDNANVPDFNLWQVCYYADVNNPIIASLTKDSSLNQGFFFNINYASSSPPLTTVDTTWYGVGATSSSQILINPEYFGTTVDKGCISITKHYPLAANNWQALASLWYYNNYTGQTYEIAETPILHFTINGGTKTNAFGEAPPPVLQCNFVISNTGVSTVDNVVNGIINGTCNVFSYLFQPKASDFNQFSGLWVSVRTKPPFGYFTASQASLNSFSTSSPTYNSSTLPSLAPLAALTSPIDAGLGFLTVISFLLWILYRIKAFTF